MRATISTGSPARSEFGLRALRWWPTTTSSWMWLGFLVAFVIAAAALAIFGAGSRGTVIALRVTARWSFLLFWLAYVGSAAARLWGPRFDGLARRGRDFGLAYASAQLVHVALVVWFIHITVEPTDAMVFFWAGIACTYLLALLSWPRLRDAIGQRAWRIVRTVAMEYIALTFAADFIYGPLQAVGLGKYPLGYVPFALMLIGGAGLRIAASRR